MDRKTLVIAGLLALALPAAAAIATSARPAPAANDWDGVSPSITMSVKPAAQAGSYDVTATISDLATGKVLGEPRLLVRDGMPASIAMGSESGTQLRLQVTADSQQASANYTTEILQHQVLVNRQSASIALR